MTVRLSTTPSRTTTPSRAGHEPSGAGYARNRIVAPSTAQRPRYTVRHGERARQGLPAVTATSATPFSQSAQTNSVATFDSGRWGPLIPSAMAATTASRNATAATRLATPTAAVGSVTSRRVRGAGSPTRVSTTAVRATVTPAPTSTIHSGTGASKRVPPTGWALARPVAATITRETARRRSPLISRPA
jgi:hypothetical protein